MDGVEVSEACRFKNGLFNLVGVSIHLPLYYFIRPQQLSQKQPNEWPHYNTSPKQEEAILINWIGLIS